MKVPVHHLVVDEEDLRPMDEDTKSEDIAAKPQPPLAVVKSPKRDNAPTTPPAEILEPTLKVPMSLFLKDRPRDSIPKERSQPRPIPQFEREYQNSARKKRTDKARLLEAKADAVKTREIEIPLSLDPQPYFQRGLNALKQAGPVLFVVCHRAYLASDTGLRKFRSLPGMYQMVVGLALIVVVSGTVYRSGKGTRARVAPETLPLYSNPLTKAAPPTRDGRPTRKVATASKQKPQAANLLQSKAKGPTRRPAAKVKQPAKAKSRR